MSLPRILIGRTPSASSRTTIQKRSFHISLPNRFNDACGLLGCPNVGKSTLFNAIVGSETADAQNYPFCTIDPNTARVSIRDTLLDELAKIHKTHPVYNHIEIRDIAGLIKGAHEGKGLGNQFLANLRGCALLFHIVRCFPDENITSVEGSPVDLNPINEFSIIEQELIEADRPWVQKKLLKLRKEARNDPQLEKYVLPVVEKIAQDLENGTWARRSFDNHYSGKDTISEREAFLQLGTDFYKTMLTFKPSLVVGNVGPQDAATGNQFSQTLKEYTEQKGCIFVHLSASLESEVAQLGGGDDPEAIAESLEFQKEYLGSYGMDKPKVPELLAQAQTALGLHSYYTVGEMEARAWPFPIGSNAKVAAGAIHTDFIHQFQEVQIWQYNDIVNLGGKDAVTKAGKMKAKGKDYIMGHGDVVEFKLDRNKKAPKKK